MFPDFSTWLKAGMDNGWISPPVCYTHDGIPMSITEDAEFTDGSDPCIHIIRCYEDRQQKEQIEANSFQTVWRNPFRNEDYEGS